MPSIIVPVQHLCSFVPLKREENRRAEVLASAVRKKEERVRRQANEGKISRIRRQVRIKQGPKVEPGTP